MKAHVSSPGQREAIFCAIRSFEHPVSAAEIIAATGLSDQVVYSALQMLRYDGSICKAGRTKEGKLVWVARRCPRPTSTATSWRRPPGPGSPRFRAPAYTICRRRPRRRAGPPPFGDGRAPPRRRDLGNPPRMGGLPLAARGCGPARRGGGLAHPGAGGLRGTGLAGRHADDGGCGFL